MDVGIQMVLATYGWQGMSDDQAWDEEIRLARLADELGFDALWAVEHHFNDYSFCPDNLQLMAYLAAVCPHIDLGTAAVILPRNDASGGRKGDRTRHAEQRATALRHRSRLGAPRIRCIPPDDGREP
jgi:hypothetical protein